jgi:hypothetical protein
MRSILQRVCWNTNGWQHPSGAAAQDSGYPQEYGFGHEEWNFRKEHAVEGNVFGYMYRPPVPNKKNGSTWNIYFYTIDPVSNNKV